MSADEVLADVLRAKLDAQPWYRTYANTVTTLVTLAVNALWLLVSLGVDVDPTVIGGVAAAIQALGVVGVKLTPNGVTSRIRWRGRHYALYAPTTVHRQGDTDHHVSVILLEVATP